MPSLPDNWLGLIGGIAILIVVPVGVWAIHEYYLPLDILAQKIMNRIGVRW